MVTIFKNFNEVVEHKSIPVILDEIRTGKYKPGIIYLRKSLAENKTEAYNKAKKFLIHYFNKIIVFYMLNHFIMNF